MPILNVELLGNEELPNLALKIANAAGKVLGSETGHTWVKLRYLPLAHYAENGGTAPDLRPVFVSILLGASECYEAKGELARSLAAAIGEAIGCNPNNVHILFEPDARGRIAFGGGLLE